jgi:hypothetical protein
LEHKRDGGARTERLRAAFVEAFVEVPVFEAPISRGENFLLSARREGPLWAPSSLGDFQTLMAQDVAPENSGGIVIHTDFRDPRNATEDYAFTDWFNTSWTWVASASGAMLTPGTMLLDDITRWDIDLKWPDLSAWDFRSRAEDFMKNDYNPDRVLHYDIGRGCTERLISLVGGYTEGMLALAMEPDAVRAFLDRYADFVIALYDTLRTLYPFQMVTYHDDWGTERDTFFSERMMEDIVFEPTKRIIDHVKASGAVFELHSCGNVTRFMPHMVALGADFLQLQRRAVDMPAMKAKYGDKVGFCATIEDFAPGTGISPARRRELIRRTLHLYGEHGGLYAMPFSPDPEELTALLTDVYELSREYYGG